jgi:hypothetical protein
LQIGNFLSSGVECYLFAICICQPCVLERRSGLLDHLTLLFSMSFSTELGMFFIYRRCTPPDGLYGITDRSIGVDRGLYEPISIQEVFAFDS